MMGIAGELKRCVEEQRYGVSEVSEEEFHRDYVTKKKSGTPVVPPRTAWQREQIGSKGYEAATHPQGTVVVGAVEKASVVVADIANEALRIEDPPTGPAPGAVPAAIPRPPAPTPAVGSRSRPPIKVLT